MYRGHFRDISQGFAFMLVGYECDSLWIKLVGIGYWMMGLALWKLYIDEGANPNA